ncbi:murein DD-endopeptidase MepM/ murein hydrolase activator NlpD [Lutibacter sp. Hel_I_33_5]|uniref:M23 family metallopeptidase n=1 Tax=Lutibacter sp. Hel_I_33_5 TaxID=1566289 RepID=UPI0011A0559F|nr:peptidoglycan DD-metalloendopeptidase family protein [Lutibacter sp. Hel_I_33_5]TVZ56469.1 murein DD-endopeptidase MepM/ murein hydrolase activator NlpD [Lutibacter sp. Hel_I_33_5]
MKKFIVLLILSNFLFSCKSDEKKPILEKIIIPKVFYEYGYKLNDFKVINDTIKNGESFGIILDRHHVSYPKINKIAGSIKDIFDVRRVRAGKPYTVLASKDSTEKAEIFIYKHDKINSTIVNLKDSTITAYKYKKPIKLVEKIAAGKISSSLSEAMDSLHLKPNLTYTIADDIYAWTLDFQKLQKGDEFKFIYEEKYINDTVFAGYGKVKAAVFKHKGKDLYAFRYVPDSIKGIYEYYNESGDMLRSQFLKSPIKFQYRISSRYNLKRRIAHYGYRIKAHRGTDFAAANGTPIMSTANGTVIESTRRGGNGIYVAVRHNNTYTTKYFHMSRRKARVGDFVKQGDIIGYVGSTGSSSGNHVCYRFWKNGKEVDPFKQKLPSAKPLKKSLIPTYKKHIIPLKNKLENFSFTKEERNKELIVKH